MVNGTVHYTRLDYEMIIWGTMRWEASMGAVWDGMVGLDRLMSWTALHCTALDVIMEMQEIIILWCHGLHFYMILLHDTSTWHESCRKCDVERNGTWYMISAHYRLNWCCLFHFACTCTSLCHNGVVQYSMVYDLFILWSERTQCRESNQIELNESLKFRFIQFIYSFTYTQTRIHIVSSSSIQQHHCSTILQHKQNRTRYNLLHTHTIPWN